MWSSLFFNSCVNVWSWLAQASPVAPPAAPAAPALPAAVPAPENVPLMNQVPMIPAHTTAYTVAHSLVLFVYFIICAGLITCVMFQTTKSEGLSGVIGGSVSTSLSRKKSSEEMLASWTTRLAVSFIVFSFVIWLAFGRG